MDKGIKIAIALAAIACILVGVLWDRIVQGDDGQPTDEPGDTQIHKSLQEYHLVGVRQPDPAPEGETTTQRTAGTIVDEMPGLPPTRKTGTDDEDTERPTRSDTRRAQPEIGLGDGQPTGGSQDYVDHEVAENEVLGAISQKYYDTTRYWRHIMAFNGIEDARKIRPGQTLKIPLDPERVQLPD